MSERKAQYTIRGVATDVDKTLRKIAEARCLSLNAYLVQELERIADQSSAVGRHHDLDFAIGSMSDGQQVDLALRDFERIDPEIWN